MPTASTASSSEIVLRKSSSCCSLRVVPPGEAGGEGGAGAPGGESGVGGAGLRALGAPSPLDPPLPADTLVAGRDAMALGENVKPPVSALGAPGAARRCRCFTAKAASVDRGQDTLAAGNGGTVCACLIATAYIYTYARPEDGRASLHKL